MAIGRRLGAGALAMTATFGLLTAGAAVAREATVTSPVAQALRLPGVVAYRLEDASGTPVVALTLADGVDVERLCERLDVALAPVFGQAPTIQAAGRGQSRLRPLLEALAVPVAQGIATGGFVAMSNAVERLAARSRASARVEVDAAAVYVTLVPAAQTGDAYAVFPRPAAGSEEAGG